MSYIQFMYFGKEPYGIEGLIENNGDGSNMYRGEDFAQPRALLDGDVLSNGWQVEGNTFVAFNSSVGIQFTNGITRIVAPRLPLQLMSDKEGVLPGELRIGQILQTGCVVLDTPKPIGPVKWHKDQVEVEIKLTGGLEGHELGAPYDLELAVFDEEYPPRPDTILGAFVLERTLKMRENARCKLPQLGQLTLDI